MDAATKRDVRKLGTAADAAGPGVTGAASSAVG